MNTLRRLQSWYSAHCNGDWEHSSGITIRSCDNPGWWITVNLSGTALQTREFPEIAIGVDEQRFPLGSDWLSCYIENSSWHGAGDETKLEPPRLASLTAEQEAVIVLFLEEVSFSEDSANSDFATQVLEEWWLPNALYRER